MDAIIVTGATCVHLEFEELRPAFRIGWPFIGGSLLKGFLDNLFAKQHSTLRISIDNGGY